MKNYTDVTVLLDRSGSMQSIKKDMEGAFDRFAKDQAKVTTDECVVSLYQFDTECDNVYTNRPVAVIPNLEITPRGMTALYDAMYEVIEKTGERLSRIPESDRPARVVFVVITDGEENSSRRASAAKLKELVEQQQNKYNWQFVYLGANQDAMLAGSQFGISKNFTYSYTADSLGTNKMWDTISGTLAAYRCSNQTTMSFVQDNSTATEKE